MKNNNFYEDLKNYFDTTTREKVLEDWDKSAEHDKMGVTVEEFLDNTNQQETIEEAADIYVKLDSKKTPLYCMFNDIFKEGAKWQQEQILDFLYSEITERKDYSASKMCEVVIKFIENM